MHVAQGMETKGSKLSFSSEVHKSVYTSVAKSLVLSEKEQFWNPVLFFQNSILSCFYLG